MGCFPPQADFQASKMTPSHKSKSPTLQCRPWLPWATGGVVFFTWSNRSISADLFMAICRVRWFEFDMLFRWARHHWLRFVAMALEKIFAIISRRAAIDYMASQAEPWFSGQHWSPFSPMELLELQLQAKQGQIVAAKVYGPANISGPNAGLIWSKANMIWFKYGSNCYHLSFAFKLVASLALDCFREADFEAVGLHPVEYFVLVNFDSWDSRCGSSEVKSSHGFSNLALSS